MLFVFDMYCSSNSCQIRSKNCIIYRVYVSNVLKITIWQLSKIHTLTDRDYIKNKSDSTSLHLDVLLWVPTITICWSLGKLAEFDICHKFYVGDTPVRYTYVYFSSYSCQIRQRYCTYVLFILRIVLTVFNNLERNYLCKNYWFERLLSIIETERIWQLSENWNLVITLIMYV